MGRPIRRDPVGGWHHVVNRGVARADIFRDDRDRVEFGRLIGVAHERHGMWVHAYCLMSNHYHLLVECPEGRLSAGMHLIGSQFVRHANERSGRDGPLFRGRFFARLVDDDADVVCVVRYIHRNPLAIVPERDLDRYRWSSHRTYRGFRRTPTWMRTDVVASLVGGPAGMDELVHGGRAAAPATDRGLLHLVGLAVDEHVADGSANRVDRTVMALMLDTAPPALTPRVRSALAFPSTNAEQSARSRARRRAAEQPGLRAAAEAAMRWAA